MATPIERIKSLISSLNEKDQSFANKFIEQRDFEKLRELVKSAIVIAKKKFAGKDEFLQDLTISNMSKLYSEVDEYCLLLGCDADIDDEYEEDDCYEL